MRLIYLLIPLLFTTTGVAKDSNISEIRKLYILASQDIAKCEKLDIVTRDFTPSLNPVGYSYNIAAQIFKSKHLKNPFKKYTTFKNASKKLDYVIELNPNSTEIRFLRYLIQLNAPGFLGYNDNLFNDYNFIANHIHQEKEDLKDFILSIIDISNNQKN